MALPTVAPPSRIILRYNRQNGLPISTLAISTNRRFHENFNFFQELCLIVSGEGGENREENQRLRFGPNRDDRRLSEDFWSVGKHNWTFGDLTNVQVNLY